MSSLNAGQYGAWSAGPLDQDGESDRGEHEYDRSPSGHLGQEIRGSAGTERSLGSLAAKGAREVGTLTLLEKNYPNQDEANNNVNSTD
jgi:hypothetical protein